MRKKNKKIVTNNNFTEFLLYTTPNGKVKVEIFLHNENIWLTQKLIALLFGCSTDNVSLHLKNIFGSAELHESSVTEEFSVTADDGKKYKTKHYNLDAIISVGYRVNSTQATLFRIWATERLKEYIIKGFSMNDERLKDPRQIFGIDYFEEQLVRAMDKIEFDEKAAMKKFEEEISARGGCASGAKKYNRLTQIMFGDKFIKEQKDKNIDLKAYAKYILREGTKEEKRDILLSLKTEIFIKGKEIVIK